MPQIAKSSPAKAAGRTILSYVLSTTCTSYEKIPISLACLQIRVHRQKSLSVARYAYVFLPVHSNLHPA